MRTAAPAGPAAPARPARPAWLLATIAVLLPILGCAAGALYLYPNEWSQLGLGALLALAALLCGALLGFLFGVPRGPRAHQRASTNLEQVSDWLTKILIGVALVNLGELGSGTARLFGTVGDALGGGQQAGIAAGAGLSFFAVTGFIIAYLMARTALRGLFEGDDDVDDLVGSAVEQRSSRDAQALALVAEQLDVHAPGVDHRRLRKALAAASPAARSHAFLLAAEQRSRTWRDPLTKLKTTRTIPVLQALTEFDGRNHRYWGELGFALKDQAIPDRAAALVALDTAIARRGDAGEHGYEVYEFARALARAGHLNSARRHDPGADAEIGRDLSVAYHNESIRRRIVEAQRRIADRGEHVDFADLEIDRIKQLLPK